VSVRSTPVARVTLVASALLAVAGLVDSIRHQQWDALVLFTGILLAVLGLLLATYTGRPAVPLRADLARWLRATASTNGERPGDVADRAIASYQAGLVRRERTSIDDVPEADHV
jgi:cytochrome c biogenesis protein CcdA